MMTWDEVTAWTDAALADGWSSTPMYEREPEEQARILRSDGWYAMVFRRPQKGYMKYPECNVTVWGPDGLQIKVPTVYTRAALEAAIRTCQYCGAADVDTIRLSFAGRSCKPCRVKLAPTIEAPGWCD